MAGAGGEGPRHRIHFMGGRVRGMLRPTASVLTAAVHSEMVKTVRFMLRTTSPIPFITRSFRPPRGASARGAFPTARPFSQGCSRFRPGAATSSRSQEPTPHVTLFLRPAVLAAALRRGPHRAPLFEPSPRPTCAPRGGAVPAVLPRPSPTGHNPSTGGAAQELPGSTQRTGLRHALATEGANSDRGVSARRCGGDTKLTMSERRAQAAARPALGAASQRAPLAPQHCPRGEREGGSAAWRRRSSHPQAPLQTGQRTVRKCASGASAAPTPERKEKGRGTESRRARGRGARNPEGKGRLLQGQTPAGGGSSWAQRTARPALRGPAAWPLRPYPPGLA